MIDYKFLFDYLQHEISRLAKIKAKEQLSLTKLILKRDEANAVPFYDRDWQHRNRLKKLDGKIGELQMKLKILSPRLNSLRVQLSEIEKFIN